MGRRVHIHASFDTRLSPERVIGSLTDFSDERPRLWTNIDPAKYEVHEVGDGWAVVTEGNREPDTWARERYRWDASQVSIKAEASNFCKPGDGTDIVVSSGPDGGSHIELDWEREAAAPEFEPIMDWARLNGDAFLRQSYQSTWDGLADVHAAPDGPHARADHDRRRDA